MQDKLKINSIEEFRKFRNEIIVKKGKKKSIVSICTGTCCTSLGSQKIVEKFKIEVRKHNLNNKVEIKETGCLGFCSQGPMAIIFPEEIAYFKIRPEDVVEIVGKTLVGKKVIKSLLYKDPKNNNVIQKLEDIPFYKYQRRLLLQKNAKINPKDIEDYIAQGGYTALVKTIFEMKPEDVINTIDKANLRGRGGGGFSTSFKWQATRDALEETKYIIANLNEGDPGAYMDRALVHGNPHNVLEGLIIGAYAIGAHEGYIYVNEEFPEALENIFTTIKQAEDYGLLGENILGSNFSFDVKVFKSAGMFVSGESSAIMTGLEGTASEPRPKYIHTSIKGARGKPTCLNNVETLAHVPLIINKGANWYNKIGTKESSGTKIISLVGDIINSGLVEIPMGMTVREMIYNIGGGIKGEKEFKAVEIGGPSGGFISKKNIDLPIDFDELANVNAMIGSVVVMDEDKCMIDMAKYFVDFLLNESCGKCIPCREGLRALSKILEDITKGKGRDEDVLMIEDILETMSEASLCALGTTAVNPVITSLRYFIDEWDQHIKEKYCPTNICKLTT